jgi:hypothetical protein
VILDKDIETPLMISNKGDKIYADGDYVGMRVGKRSYISAPIRKTENGFLKTDIYSKFVDTKQGLIYLRDHRLFVAQKGFENRLITMIHSGVGDISYCRMIDSIIFTKEDIMNFIKRGTTDTLIKIPDNIVQTAVTPINLYILTNLGEIKYISYDYPAEWKRIDLPFRVIKFKTFEFCIYLLTVDGEVWKLNSFGEYHKFRSDSRFIDLDSDGERIMVLLTDNYQMYIHLDSDTNISLSDELCEVVPDVYLAKANRSSVLYIK